MAYNKRTSKRKTRRGGTKKKEYIKNPIPVKITNENIKKFVSAYIDKGKNTKDLPINLRGIPIGKWDVSKVTDMNKLFSNTKFNEDISEWDVSNVTNMSHMFYATTMFDKPLNNWDVSNVTNMHYMFCSTYVFNQPLNNWDVSNVTDMSLMFAYAEKFNQPLNTWDVSKVKLMTEIFSECPIERKNFENWEFNGLLIEPDMGSYDLHQVYKRYQRMTPEEKSILHNENIKLRNEYFPSRNKAKFFKARKEVLKLMDKLDEKYETIDTHSTPKTSAETRHERNLNILMYQIYERYQRMTPEEKRILHNENIELRNEYINSKNKEKFLKAHKEVLKLMDVLDEKYKTMDTHSTPNPPPPKTPTPKTSAEKRHEQNLDILMYHDGPGRELLEYIGPDNYEEEEK